MISMEALKKTWHPDFCPSYTPMEMLDKGIFEGIYTSAIQDIPAEYKNHKKVLKRGSDPDVSINHYGIKSRQSLKEWQRKGWTTRDSPLGWWEWYIKYFLGRRLGKEDDKQIARWKSFVARHMGQVAASCRLGDEKCHTKQRQGLLQWAWDSTTKFDEDQREKNLKRIARLAGVTVEEVSTESLPASFRW